MSKLELEISGPSSFEAESWMQKRLQDLQDQKRLWNYEKAGKMYIFQRFTKESGRIVEEGEKE